MISQTLISIHKEDISLAPIEIPESLFFLNKIKKGDYHSSKIPTNVPNLDTSKELFHSFVF